MPEQAQCGAYEVVREGEEIILKIDANACLFFPSVEDDARTMALVVDALVSSGSVTKIVINQRRDIEYDFAQTQVLVDLAGFYKQVVQLKCEVGLLAEGACRKFVDSRIAELHDVLLNLLKKDPVGAFVELMRMHRREQSLVEKGILSKEGVQCLYKYHQFLKDLLSRLEQTKIIVLSKPFLSGFRIGDREVYRRIFAPSIKPDFMFTKLLASLPPEAEILSSYEVGGCDVTIFGSPDSVQYTYHVVPPEFKLSEEKYALLDAARKILAEHKPKRSEFIDPARMRDVFSRIGSDLLDDLSAVHGVRLRSKDRDELKDILVRYTIGFGLIEVLLADDRVQDVSINSPLGRSTMFIVHNEFGDCMTNIVPTMQEAESWASKLRLMSGRPLDEANPILDTELVLPSARARVAAISSPLNPSGLAFAFRRHRDKPWTLPLFIKTGMISPLAAGFLSFLIDGARTLLVAGTRSAGKTSLLGSLMVEIMRRARVITIEDTLELPVDALRALNYNVQQMKVASALTRGTTEVSADEGIRTTLRLGDSALVVGEVRSVEAKALYEAMRVGALANVVMGTIHGDSPYGVFDRVVNDLGVPRTSFKATDIIVVANPIRSPDGIHRWRRVTQITEVRKHWEQDPLAEHGFVDLFKYDAINDRLEPSSDLLNGDSEIIKGIASNVREWAGNWEAVWDNVLLRANIKDALVKFAEKLGRPDLLEAEFVVMANDEFHRVSERVREEIGLLDSKRIFFEWNDWLQRAAKKGVGV